MSDPLADNMRSFCMSMQAHRMRDFGWESSVNDYTADQKRYLAMVLPEFRHVLLMAAEVMEQDNGID